MPFVGEKTIEEVRIGVVIGGEANGGGSFTSDSAFCSLLIS